MKSTELRIGNLLRDKVTKTELKVIKLTEENIITYVIDRSKFPLEDGWGIEGIPLTEERLLEFGFEKDASKYNICWFLNHVYIWFVDGEYINELDLPIDYVHQLQNLYFALKGEELTYGGNK